MSETLNPLWQPSDQFIADSNLKAYEKWLADHKGLSFHNYNHLWEWSTENIEDFWESLWEYFEITSTPYNKVLSGVSMQDASWFEGARLNYAEHIFKKKSTARPALIFYNESGKQEISWTGLESKVASLQNYLKQSGIKSGDRVAGYLPNTPEAIIAFLATISIGAIWTCCSPDFGEATVIERFRQVEPKLLIAVDGYSYGGKNFNKLDSVISIRAEITSLERLILIPYLSEESNIDQATKWEEATTATSAKLDFESVPFAHPIWILYSSGTTGKPKAITHSHGGVLLEHYKYLSFHNDAKEGENFFWFSTTGWMMWNFLQASMLVGAVPVLYDGSPAYPDLEILWKISSELPIHHFGTSAPFLIACMKEGLELGDNYNLTALRSIGSTGAPLPPETFQYVYDNISENVWLCSMSGGTDVCTAFVGGCPYEPVHKGYIQGRALGCALYSYSDNEEKLTGNLGEMVIEKPMPSMPIYFWNDENKERYRASYFSKYKGKWRHGDFIKIQENGALTIHGRSDATLNRNGIRIGTAEIYSVIDKIKSIKDSLILNLEQSDGDDIMPLFIVLKEGVQLDDQLKKEIKSNLRSQCSPRHIPTNILEVKDVPYTLSGKKMEVPIKHLLMGIKKPEQISRDAIRNPEAMDHFIDLIGELR